MDFWLPVVPPQKDENADMPLKQLLDEQRNPACEPVGGNVVVKVSCLCSCVMSVYVTYIIDYLYYVPGIGNGTM